LQLYFNTLIPNITSTMALAIAVFDIGSMSPNYTNNLYATSVAVSLCGLVTTLLQIAYLTTALKKPVTIASISCEFTRVTATPVKKTSSLQNCLEMIIIVNVLMQTSATNKSIMPSNGLMAIYSIFILAVCNILLLVLRSRQTHKIAVEDIFISLKSTQARLGLELVEDKAIKYAQRHHLDLAAIQADSSLKLILHDKAIMHYLRNRIIRDVYVKNLKYSTLLGFCISSLSLSALNNKYKYTYTALAVIGLGYFGTAIKAALVKREIANRIDTPKAILPMYKSRTHPINGGKSPNCAELAALMVNCKF